MKSLTFRIFGILLKSSGVFGNLMGLLGYLMGVLGYLMGVLGCLMGVPIKYPRTPIKYPRTLEAGARHIGKRGGAATPPHKSEGVWGGRQAPPAKNKLFGRPVLLEFC